MAAQRGQAFQRVEEGEESAKIAQEAAENGQNEDTARWAAVERRLDQEARARMESIISFVIKNYIIKLRCRV